MRGSAIGFYSIVLSCVVWGCLLLLVVPISRIKRPSVATGSTLLFVKVLNLVAGLLRRRPYNRPYG
jgi:hypothetical protein